MQLAESGVFTVNGFSPMKSAELADLYEALTYLSAKKSEGLFYAEYSKTKE